MEAPDKIYLNTPKIQPELDNTTWDTKTYDDCENIKYIRKDALLKWAKEKNKRIDTDEGDYSLGYVSAVIDLIEKIESL